ncbi:Protein PSK SIMULATOR 2 [Linum perenne]
MGGVCAGGVKKNVNAQPAQVKSSRFSGKLAKPHKSSSAKELENSSSIPNGGKLNKKKNKKQKKMTTTMMHPGRDYSGELLLSVSRELKPSKPAGEGALAKVNHKTSFLGKAGTMGLEKTLEVLDTLGSSMSNLNARSGFISGMPSRGNRISILAFEVANTISKGANLFQSLSEENVNFLKKEILHSEGVKQLVSTDMKELLAIAASDKRLDAELSTDKQTREEAEMTVLELTTLVQHTSELYHELHSLDRFEQDYQRKVEELQSLHLPQKGDSLSMLQSELKEQRKLVRSLKKRSLWSKSLEEIMEKLVDIVTYLHQAILEAFGSSGISVVVDEPANHQKLGKAGLALHYANMITQIDNIASRPTSLPPNTRDSLYRGLPPSVKTSLRSRLQMFDDKEELTITQVKAEMEKTMHWLVPIAANTTKSDYGKTNTAAQGNLIRLQTLYHADKEKTDQNILEAVAWLHRLIKLVRQRDNGLRTGGLTLKSATYRGQDLHSKMQQQQQFVLLNQTRKPHVPLLSEEDRDLLNKVSRKRLIPGISKSQEFSRANKSGRGWASLSRNKSTGTSPAKEIGRRRKMVHQPRANLLDILDGLHSM